MILSRSRFVPYPVHFPPKLSSTLKLTAILTSLALQMRKERWDGVASKRRESSVEDSLARFAEMTKGTEEGQKWCLRAKMSFDDPNKAMRDTVIYRCVTVPHHRTG